MPLMWATILRCISIACLILCAGCTGLIEKTPILSPLLLTTTVAPPSPAATLPTPSSGGLGSRTPSPLSPIRPVSAKPENRPKGAITGFKKKKSGKKSTVTVTDASQKILRSNASFASNERPRVPSLASSVRPKAAFLGLQKRNKESDLRPTESLIPASDSQKVISIDEILRQCNQDVTLQNRTPLPINLSDLFLRALCNSKNIQIQRLLPIEDRQLVAEEYGEFDWRQFLETRFLHNDNPVRGSDQVFAPTQNRIREEDHEIVIGLKKNTTFGGQLEISQSARFQDDNTGFLAPPDQSISNTSVTFQQELLRDGGRETVLSQALIASYKADGTHAAAVAEVSDQLQQMANQYWDLYQARGLYFVQQSLVRWAEQTLQELRDRQRIDAEENIIAQAEALLFEAQSQLRRARIDVREAQNNLFRLVNDPSMDQEHMEIITSEPLVPSIQSIDSRSEMAVAIRNRGEVHQAIADLQAGATQYRVDVNQILPKLTLALESSLNGLNGNNDFRGSFGDGLDNDPSVQVTLNFEMFLGNRQARAAARRSKIAMQRLQFEYEDVLEQIKLDVRKSVGALNELKDILGLQSKAIDAGSQELEYLAVRRNLIPKQGASTSLALEQNFLAINRLIQSQNAFIQVVADQQRALIDLQRAKGQLVQSKQIAKDAGIFTPGVRDAFHFQQIGKDHHLQQINRHVIEPNHGLRP